MKPSKSATRLTLWVILVCYVTAFALGMVTTLLLLVAMTDPVELL